MSALDWIHLARVKARLAAGPLPPGAAFAYFAAGTLADALQLAVLDGYSHEPGPYGPVGAWVSFAIGGSSVFGSYWLNGAARGGDFLARWFALCAVIGLYVAAPLQLALALPRWLPGLSASGAFAPTCVVAANLLLFSLVLHSFRDIARR